MHSPTYRETYAADLKKALPRIPIASEFRGFVDAGRRLSELHLGYEEVPPYPLDGLDVEATGDPYDFFAVGAKKMPFGKPTTEQKAAGERHDRTVIRYNDRITLSGIPLEAYRYMLGSRSAIEWIIDRYYVKTDKPPASSTIRTTGPARSRTRATSSTCSRGSSRCRWRR